MNTAQRRTARGLAVIAIGGLVLSLGMLVLELLAVRSGGNATISEAFWRLWATQPWVILVSSHALAGPSWWLFGHFTGQSRVVYDAIREGIDLQRALRLAVSVRDAYRLQGGKDRDRVELSLDPWLIEALSGPKES